MSKSCLKSILAVVLIVGLFLLFANPVFAARTINSATLNGATSVTVAPSTSITAAVTVTTSGGGPNDNWFSTSYQIGSSSTVCVNHADYTVVGLYTESFTITAPSSIGTYNVSFIAYSDDACSNNNSNTFTLTNGIVVVAPTSTPSPTPTPTPTNTPTPTPTPTNTPTPTPTLAPGQPTSTPTPTATLTPTTSSPTSTPTPTPTPTQTPPPVYYPLVVLTPYSPNPTNRASLTFLGKASIEQGTINAVEFSIDASFNWQQAKAADKSFNSRNETFTFTTSNLSEGEHTILVRAKSNLNVYTQENLYETSEVTVITTKPTVTLEPISQVPTKNQTPTIKGAVAVSDLTTLSKVEVSYDNKETWFTANVENNSYSFTFKKLEDANYSIVARATDAVGNTGESPAQTLIVDTIPPTLGGTMATFGSQAVTPDPDGTMQAVAGVPINITLSLKGGVTQARISTTNESYDLKPIQGTNLWATTLVFKIAGENSLILQAQDGALNKIEKKLQTILVRKPGKVYNLTSNRPLKNVKVSVFYFDTISKTWVLWDAEGFGQRNPFLTTADGTYSFMVPAGKYYIEANLPGFHALQSEILDFSKTSLIHFDLPLESKPHFIVTLPFIGDVTFSFPSISVPKTLSVLQISEKPFPQLLLSEPTQTLPFPLLSSFAGKKAILTFLSPWSPHAVDQAAILSKANQSILANQSIIGIIVQESQATADIFMRRGRYQFPYLADEVGKTASEYNVITLPQHFFIDSKGIVRQVISGIMEENVILEKLNQLP